MSYWYKGISYCSSKYFCGLGCFICTYTDSHTHLHTELISLISLSGKSCNSKLFGPNLEQFTCIQIPGNGGCLALSGLALNKSPQDNHTTIINYCYCVSLFPSDQLSTCHSHLVSTLAPVVSSSWFSSPLPASISPWCV